MLCFYSLAAASSQPQFMPFWTSENSLSISSLGALVTRLAMKIAAMLMTALLLKKGNDIQAQNTGRENHVL